MNMNDLDYVVWDTETTGLYKDNKSYGWDGQPYILQIAAIRVSEGKVVDRLKEYVSIPEDIIIPAEATNVHGITHDVIAANNPITQEQMINAMIGITKDIDMLVGYNIPFDVGMLYCAISKLYGDDPVGEIFEGIPQVCVMRAVTPLCKIPSPYRRKNYKWPKLIEAYNILIGGEMKNAHDALADVLGTDELFRYLVERASANE